MQCSCRTFIAASRHYHMKNSHGLALGRKPARFYSCPICEKVFDVPSRLKRHIASHSSESNSSV